MQSILALVLLSKLAYAHVAAFTLGMYCLNGTEPGVDNQNTNDAVQPLYNLTKSDWWMHHVNKCDEFPPEPGNYLEVPAGGNFTVELASNRGQTTFSFDGKYTSDWGDGKDHPDDYSVNNLGGEPNPSNSSCIPSPNLHTQNETMAAGTAFAISYQSDITKVTDENLVVFTVKYHTPWKRLTTYQVPAGLPECPPGGCHCVWGWVPNHCGQPNMYMFPHKCIVTGATGTTPLAPAQPPVWCEDDQTKCILGAKQMIFWNQFDGNNVVLEGTQLNGESKSPNYNSKMGFTDGAQVDIFATDTTTTSVPDSESCDLDVSIPTPQPSTADPLEVGAVTLTETQTVTYCPTPTSWIPTNSADMVAMTINESVSLSPPATTPANMGRRGWNRRHTRSHKRSF